MTTTPLTKAFGKFIKTHRVVHKQWTQEELAHKSGISRPTVLAIEKGGDVKFTSAERLSKCLGTSLKEFFTSYYE